MHSLAVVPQSLLREPFRVLVYFIGDSLASLFTLSITFINTFLWLNAAQCPAIGVKLI